MLEIQSGKWAEILTRDTQDGTILAGLVKVNQCDIRRNPVDLLPDRPEDGTARNNAVRYWMSSACPSAPTRTPMMGAAFSL